MHASEVRKLGPGDLMLTATGGVVMVSEVLDRGALILGIRGDDGGTIRMTPDEVLTKIGYTDPRLPFPRRTVEAVSKDRKRPTKVSVEAGQKWHHVGRERSVVVVLHANAVSVTYRAWVCGEEFGRKKVMRRKMFENEFRLCPAR